MASVASVASTSRAQSIYSGYSTGISTNHPGYHQFYFGKPQEKKYEYYAPSSTLVNAGVVAFVATVFFIVSFTSPYWLQSYEYTYSDFNNMGLWEFCFNGFRYPKYQFDHKFVGCNYIFSQEYRIIREWMSPSWFMATQAFMTIALISSLTSLIILSIVMMRLPVNYVMRYEWHLVAGSTFCQIVTVVSIFWAVFVFGIMCWSRDWLLTPNFNYLSWSYAFAVISGAFHLFSGLMLLNETYSARDRKREATGMQMESQDMGPLDNQGYI